MLDRPSMQTICYWLAAAIRAAEAGVLHPSPPQAVEAAEALRECLRLAEGAGEEGRTTMNTDYTPLAAQAHALWARLFGRLEAEQRPSQEVRLVKATRRALARFGRRWKLGV